MFKLWCIFKILPYVPIVPRAIIKSGNVSTLTGNGASNTNVGNVDGSSSVAAFNYSYGIVMDSTYVTCYGANTLRQVVLSTVITTKIVSSGTFSSPTYVSGDYYIWSI